LKEELEKYKEEAQVNKNYMVQVPVSHLVKFQKIMLRPCLDWRLKIFGCHIGCVGRMSGGGGLETKKKTN
jgi:hypothetical protein